MRFATILLLCLMMVLSAGCADQPAATQKTEEPTIIAPEPEVDAETGSIVGIVTDEELRPVPRARSSLVETQTEQPTDDKGQFTFNGVAPGEYRVVVEALGFEAAGKKVTVVAGETANVSFVLRALVLDAEAYHLSIPRVSLLQVSNSFLSIVGNYSALCGSCFHTLHFDPAPMQVLVENVWSTTAVGPLNAKVDIWWRYYDKDGGYHNHLDTYDNRERTVVPAVEITELATAKVNSIGITVEGDVLSVQHRVETWHTFAYMAELPAEFSALPPP